MEFEILNDILTGTVAQLFTQQQQMAAQTWKTSSQLGQDKSDIPRRSSLHQDDGQIGLQAQISGGASGASDNPLTQWLVIDAKQKYQQAIQKLGLDSQKIQGKHLSGFSMEDLNSEKRKVKNELKVYD